MFAVRVVHPAESDILSIPDTLKVEYAYEIDAVMLYDPDDENDADIGILSPAIVAIADMLRVNGDENN